MVSQLVALLVELALLSDELFRPCRTGPRRAESLEVSLGLKGFKQMPEACQLPQVSSGDPLGAI